MGKLYNHMNDKGWGFIHVTEYDNLQSIINSKGILSLKQIENNKVNVSFISSLDSRGIDRYKGLDNYVRLAYTCQYDMLSAAVYHGKLRNPAIIIISPEILKANNVKYTTQNAVATNCMLYSNEDDVFGKLDFQKIWTIRDWTNANIQSYKDARQSEILIPDFVGTEYFCRIIVNSSEDKEQLNTSINIDIENTKKLIHP